MGTREEQIDTLLEAWGREQPELRSRLERARMLIDNVRVVSPRPDGSLSYLIDGSRGNTYIVNVSPDGKSDCTCPDADNAFTSHCKHQIAVLVCRTVPSPRPMDPRAFEKAIRKWAKERQHEVDDEDAGRRWHWWLHDNGLFAIRLLLQEIDRLRSLQRRK